MKIGLASYAFRDGDIAFNTAQIERAMQAAQGRVDLLRFGETFLQGFNALSWNYEADREVAVSTDSEIFRQLGGLTLEYGVDLLLGYIEGADGGIYSSCAVIGQGKLLHNYRRISRGWKEYLQADGHYREGTETGEFSYRGQSIMVALCGDMWDFPGRFRTDHLLIWPVYVNFSLDEWARYEAEYAQQARLAARKTLLVNAISQDPVSHGGAFCFVDGRAAEKLAYDAEGILTVEV